MPARLVFLNADKAGTTISLGESGISFGRNPDRTVSFPPEETIVSGQHARLEFRGGDYVLHDDGSRNGTFVNSERITERRLQHGDLIQFGPGGPSARFVAAVAPPPGITDEHAIPVMRATTAVSPIKDVEEVDPRLVARRSFLAKLAAIASAGIGVLIAIPAMVSFATPILRRVRTETWVKLGDAFRFASDQPVRANFSLTSRDAWVETRSVQSVWVYSPDGENFTVYDSRCTHLGCPFNYNEATGEFTCPCHLGRFDPKTGAVLGGPPPRPLVRYESKVEDGALFVHLGVELPPSA